MNQRTFLGTSYLDVAKAAIDTFMKYRSRDPASRGDRYMLVSFDESPNAVKTGWKENHATFVSELKSLQATGLSSFGPSLKEAFDLLNVHRLHTSIDHYGQGRNPFYLEPAIVIALTDGGKPTNQGVVEQELTLPLDNHHEGSELTKELFRWDQRLFTVLLRLPGLGGVAGGSGTEDHLLPKSSISNMCEATGGKCYVITNQKSMVQCMESLTQKLHPGVVLYFKKIGGVPPLDNSGSGHSTPVSMEVDPPEEPGRGTEQPNGPLGLGRLQNEGDRETPPPTQRWHCIRNLIYVKPNPKTNIPSGFWPIPESFWPDMNITALPSRDVHPIVWFDTKTTPPLLVENFPFDKYELEPSPLTQCILEKRNPSICWQVYIHSSGKQEGLGPPFGYLKASSSLTHVTLFIMPFNYPALLPLIAELQRHRMRPPPKWRQDFAEYIASVPSYYAQPLRQALRLMGTAAQLVPDSFDGQMSYSVVSYLRKLKKQAKAESERIVAAISRNRGSEPARTGGNGIVDLGDGMTMAIGSTQVEEGVTSQSFRNPFDVSRSRLLSQLARMRTNFLHATPTTPNLIEEVSRHQVPIGQMGNYQEHLKRINPLRELDSGLVRTQLFGNPFKLERPADNKRDIDINIFADEHMVEMNRRPTSPAGRRRRLRSPSPLRTPKPLTPPPSSSPTPTPPTSVPETTSQGVSAPNRAASNSGNGTPRDQNAEITSEGSSKEHRTPGAAAKELSKMANEVLESQVPGKVAEVAREPDQPEPERNQHSGDVKQVFSLLPDQRNSAKTPLEKVQQVTKKRERTPSPTPVTPPAKRPALGSSNEAPPPSSKTGNSVNSQFLKPNAGQNHSLKKAPSPVQGLVTSRLVKPELSSASKVLGEEIQRQQGQENARLRVHIIKEVRRPGKNYDALFQLLELVKGSVEVRRAFVQDIVSEATKFKRKPLIQRLEEWGARLGSLGKGAGRGKAAPSQKR